MSTKKIIPPDEDLVLVSQAHPNWYRDLSNLNTSVLASLPKAYSEPKTAMMRKFKAGVQHITENILKINRNAKSKDSFVLETSDLPNLLKMNPYLQTILLPSEDDESNNYWSFIKYLDEHKIRHTLPKKVVDGESFVLNCNRKVECIIANSTSRATLGAHHAEVLKQFKKAIAA
ncbi:MAG: hypothetical protein H7256_07685 [Bdellovibrio sp.]|nr:hypothetical protein [Bdellovibrio sp.]